MEQVIESSQSKVQIPVPTHCIEHCWLSAQVAEQSPAPEQV
jgi:hypothetical protein